MHFVRKAALMVVIPLFSLLLLGLALDIGFVSVVTHPEKTKKILSDSDIYGSVVGGLLDQSKTISGDNVGEIQLNNSLVREAAQQTITPTYLQQNTETFIDSVYRWLEGKSATPDFMIDVSGVKTQFADNVTASLGQKLSGLPVCPAGTDVRSFDAFNAPCMPPGVTVSQAVERVRSDILGGRGFLDDQTITAADLKSSDSNQSIFSGDLKEAPKAYQRAKSSPVILAVLALLLAVAIVFLSPSRRSGFKRAGIALLIIGILMLIFAWGINRATTEALAKLKLDNNVLEEKVKILAHGIVQEIDKTYWVVGTVYSVIGAASAGGAMFLFKGGRPKSDNQGPPAPEATAADKPRPPLKKKILVQ